jgi:hypothetical protein
MKKITLFLNKKDLFLFFIYFLSFFIPYFYHNDINTFITSYINSSKKTVTSDINEQLVKYNLVKDIFKEQKEKEKELKVSLEKLFYIPLDKQESKNSLYNETDFILTSIISYRNEKKARINSKYFKENDEINGIKLIEIKTLSIVIDFQGEKKEIFIAKKLNVQKN